MYKSLGLHCANEMWSDGSLKDFLSPQHFIINYGSILRVGNPVSRSTMTVVSITNEPTQLL